MRKHLLPLLFALVPCTFAAPAARAQAPAQAPAHPGALVGAPDGAGAVSLFWLPAGHQWPAGGWRLERVDGGRATVIAEKLGPGLNADAVAQLAAEESAGLKQFAEKVSAGSLTAEEREMSLATMGQAAMADINYGLALGLRFLDRDTGGPRSYRLTALNAGGQPGAVINSSVIDPAAAGAAPAAPGGLRAESLREGVALFWSDPAAPRESPLVAFQVERDGARIAGSRRLMANKKRDTAGPAFLDTAAPGNREVNYQVYAVNLFGRRSAAAALKFLTASRAALDPPAEIHATAGDGTVELRWKLDPQDPAPGFIIERSPLSAGPFEVITPNGVKGSDDHYLDNGLTAGTVYYYRLRPLDGAGKPGAFSLPVSAVVKGRGGPATPSGLKSEAGRTRVRLTWNPSATPIAGFFVERKVAGGADWIRLNGKVNPEPLYDDYFGPGAEDQRSYRVVAVGRDNQESGPGATVDVTLLDTVPPAPPQLVHLSGEGGKVKLEFTPANPAAKSAQFLVLRAAGPHASPVVISPPLAADARGFEDLQVKPGEDYWYRLTALDKAGNRSELSDAVWVRVGSPDLPAAPKPQAAYLAEPFPRVKITFAAPPAGLAVITQRRGDSGSWFVLAGQSAPGEALDANPPTKGKLAYRIVYEAANGAQGAPSEAVEISRP